MKTFLLFLASLSLTGCGLHNHKANYASDYGETAIEQDTGPYNSSTNVSHHTKVAPKDVDQPAKPLPAPEAFPRTYPCDTGYYYSMYSQDCILWDPGEQQ